MDIKYVYGITHSFKDDIGWSIIEMARVFSTEELAQKYITERLTPMLLTKLDNKDNIKFSVFKKELDNFGE